jgi:hypothetical protein
MEWQAILLLLATPVVIGLRLIAIAERPTPSMAVTKLAGWLTLSPLLTTPIWFFILSSMPNNTSWHPAHFFSLLPGTGVTLSALFLCRPTFAGTIARAAWLLLFFDCLRWLNSFWLAAPTVWFDQGWGPSQLTPAVLGMFAPMIYALLADQIVRWHTRQADVHAAT